MENQWPCPLQWQSNLPSGILGIDARFHLYPMCHLVGSWTCSSSALATSASAILGRSRVTLRTRLYCNLQVELRFANNWKTLGVALRLIIYGSKRLRRKAGVPLYDSNFRVRPIICVSKRMHRKVGMFLKKEY